MDVRNCRGCGKLFNYVSGMGQLCEACEKQLEEKFLKAKEFIRENKGATISQVAEAAEVTPKQVEKWVREERLTFAEGSAVGIECEKCGAMIRSGRFCPACKGSMTDGLSGLYQEKKPEVVKKERETARMRFLK